MVHKTRQQRRADARETARLLTQREPKLAARWGDTVGLVGLALALFLAIFPPESTNEVLICFAVMVLTLVSPSVHLFESILPPKLLRFRTVLALVTVGLLTATLSYRLFGPAPLEIHFSSDVRLYGPGSEIAGIKWESEYSELHLVIHNTSQFDYDSFDAALTSDLFFADLRQEKGLSPCTIAPEGEPFPDVKSQRLVGGRPVGAVDGGGRDYKAIAIDRNGQPISIAGDIKRTYRIRCEKFPGGSQTSFVGALVAVNPFVNGHPPFELFGRPTPAKQLSAMITFKVSGRARRFALPTCKPTQACRT